MVATAKASHLSYVAPNAAAQEVELMFRLVGPHVDDTATAFGILATAGLFKDYVGNFFTGTVAAGLAVRAMVDEGYVWFAHFEALGSTSPAASSSDYAMLGPTIGIALLEAKGSAAKGEKTFLASVRKGYREQVRPHLGHLIGGVTATHGYSVGTWMRFGADAEMRIAYTAPKQTAARLPGLSSAEQVNAIARDRLLRQNYAGTFTLAHSAMLGLAMRSGRTPLDHIIFARFEWGGRRWLSSLLGRDWRPWLWPDHDIFYNMARHGALRLRDLPELVFAIENDIGKAALVAFLDNPDDGILVDIDIKPIETRSIRREERSARYELYGGRGAVLPDGLALIELPRDDLKIELIEWNVPKRQFERIRSGRI
jgi:hypothetical protein